MSAADEFVEWDAAYVLGALSPSERAAYERHLAGCSACRRSVGEVAGMPGLLGVVPADVASGLLDVDDGGSTAGGGDTSPSRTVRVEERRVVELDEHDDAAVDERGHRALVARVRARRRRRRAGLVAAAVAGVAAVLALALAVLVPRLGAPPELDVRLEAVTPSSLSATAHLAGRDSGTRIESDCSYGSAASGSYDDGPGDPRAFGLFVTAVDGTEEQVASWTAGPGDHVSAAGWTDLRLDEISALDIRELGRPDALLRADLSP